MASDIHKVTIDQALVRYNNPTITQERDAAIRGILHENSFTLKDGRAGPYHLHLGIVDSRLSVHIRDMEELALCAPLNVSMRPFRRLIKDYFIIWESYHEALKTSAPDKLQAVDMGRRAIHNEGAELLQKRMEAEIEADFETFRLLFTLLCVLHIK